MALTIDIKPNNDLTKSILETASALDRVSAKEKEIETTSARVAASYAKTSTYAAQLAKSTDSVGKALGDEYGATKKVAEASKKLGNAGKSDADKSAKAKKKDSEAEKKRKEEIKKSKEAIKDFGLAILGAGAAAAALGVAIAASAKGAFDAKKEAGALLDAFTARRGPEAMKLLDGLASQLGMTFGEVRSKFVEFRQAGLDNALSAKLIKMRADLMAVGLSAAAADKEISSVTSAADGLQNVAAHRALAELSRAYGGVGSGAKAAAKAMTSVEGAEAKISNVASETMAKLWERIGPGIGKAAHVLADFAIKLVKSEEGQAAIEGIAKAFDLVASAVTSENLTTGLNVVRALAVTVGTVFEVAGKAIALGASLAVDAATWLTDQIGKAVDALVDMFPDGAALVDGFIEGISSRVSTAVETVTDLAGKISGAFADALGIKSPSKVFAEYGKNTVQGFEMGEERAIRSRSMPLQEAAAEPNAVPTMPQQRQGGDSTSRSGEQIVINLTVNGGGDANEIASAVRQQIQLLLQAGALSRGGA